jgi:hypothetical protein
MGEAPNEGAQHQGQVPVRGLAVFAGQHCLSNLAEVHAAFGELAGKVEPDGCFPAQ